MAVRGELPKKANNREGAGWWMDGAGEWRPPTEWPEDTPPFEGWQRTDSGGWAPPISEDGGSSDVQRQATKTGASAPAKKKLSRQARADRRAMLTVVGALGAAVILLIVAIALISQASASDTSEVAATAEPDVIYAAEGDQAVRARQRAIAAEAPSAAGDELSGLTVRDGAEADQAGANPQDWVVAVTDCLDIDERVLIARSGAEVTFADQLECVVDRGLWTDRYLGSTIDNSIDIDVEPLVPVEIVVASGGSDWTADTREAYLTDVAHPATLHLVTAGAGHNPRSQGPDEWRPAKRSIWCAYAVDWIAVKARWDLSVSEAEVVALEEMLATCDEIESRGADPASMPVEEVAPPVIAFVGEG